MAIFKTVFTENKVEAIMKLYELLKEQADHGADVTEIGYRKLSDGSGEFVDLVFEGGVRDVVDVTGMDVASAFEAMLHKINSAR